MTYPDWITSLMPFRGPCLCGDVDARHRMLDSMKERVMAGESLEAVAEDYLYPADWVARVCAEWVNPGCPENESNDLT